ncbi:MAG: TRAP transporter substrate-binding protein DctP, partial [Pyramidobacter sp.]|nr:TRAP transporter substrate-binding protein DctP [Pyramidobacter sp.]
ALNGDFARAEIYPKVTKALGVVPLGAFYLGSRQINTRSKPVYTPEDLKGVLLRMPGLPTWLFLGRALGANPTPMAFGEVYTGLSTGAIDGQDNPMPTVKNAKFYEVAKYLSLTYHVIDSMLICAAGDTWAKLSPAQREALQKAADDARAFIDETNLKAEAELTEFFKANGVTVVTPDIKAFKDKVSAAYLADKEMSGAWDMDLYKKVQNIK